MPGWQEFYQENSGQDFELVTVAVDVQGVKKALPWLKRAKATYVSLVDTENRLGSRFDVNYVPLTILFDEFGDVVRGPHYFNGRSPAAYEEIAAWLIEGDSALKKEAASLPFKVAGFETPEAEMRFNLAALQFTHGNKDKALFQLKRALEKSPNNLIILKQIWAIENPERFYDGAVDFAWQNEQFTRRAKRKKE